MARKLLYFDFDGLGEPIRYVLMYTGKQFEDERIDIGKWPDKELKASLPFGKLPIYEEKGRTLHQSLAIIRYLAAGTDLLPSDPWEQAVLDAAAQTAYEFLFHHVLKPIFELDPVRREQGSKAFYDVSLDYYMSRFEKQLKENNGYLGGKLSWADFFLIGVLENANTYLKHNIEKDYPFISELFKKIHSLPRIKEYLAKRTPYYPYHLDDLEKWLNK